MEDQNYTIILKSFNNFFFELFKNFSNFDIKIDDILDSELKLCVYKKDQCIYTDEDIKKIFSKSYLCKEIKQIVSFSNCKIEKINKNNLKINVCYFLNPEEEV